MHRMEELIGWMMRMLNLSRKEAAEQILDSKPDWFWQTPEGEYLEGVIFTEERKERIRKPSIVDLLRDS